MAHATTTPRQRSHHDVQRPQQDDKAQDTSFGRVLGHWYVFVFCFHCIASLLTTSQHNDITTNPAQRSHTTMKPAHAAQAQDTSFDVSWAIGMSFSIFI
jgi:hypothetical protein